MAARISTIAISKPWLMFVVPAVLVALTMPLWSGAPGALGVGPLSEESSVADLTIGVETDPAIAERVAAVAIEATRTQLESDPGVTSVTPQRSAGTLQLGVDLRDDKPGARRDAVSDTPARIDPGPLKIEVGGAEVQLQAAESGLGSDLWRIAILVLPFALLLLSAVAGWRWALCLLFAVATAVPLSVAFARVIASAFDVSVLTLAVASLVALATAVEVASMLAHRATDLPEGVGKPDRIEAAVAEGGRDSLLWALFAVAVGVIAGFSGFEQASALGVGVIAGVLAGVLCGQLAGVGALSIIDPSSVRHISGPDLVARRLAGKHTGWTPPGRRLIPRLLASLRLAGLVASLGGVALAAYLLRDDLQQLFGSDPPAGLGGAALACALTCALAIVAGRTALSARIFRETASLGAKPDESAASAVDAGLPGALASTALITLFGALLLVPNLGAAGEFGLIAAAVLAFDALAVRVLCAACWARLN